MPERQSIKDIFPDKVMVGTEPSIFLPHTPCWVWTGDVPKRFGGYGTVEYRGRTWRVHRLSYWLHHGGFGDKPMVCHTCDNKPCCNPEHLFNGTNSDNGLDRIKWAAVLTSADLDAIRTSTLPDKVLARKYKITPNQVQLIRPHSHNPRMYQRFVQFRSVS